ncbi:MAG TPA: cupin domain-containing protein [Lacibacter sp.]|nr:cupin domain-containing protein [Lacibacter sp.]
MLIGNVKDHQIFEKIQKAALYKDDHIQIMLLNVPEGHELKSHTSPKDAFCIIEQGEVEFVLEEKIFHLQKGDLFHFKAGQVHSLKAVSDFSMLIVK